MVNAHGVDIEKIKVGDKFDAEKGSVFGSNLKNEVVTQITDIEYAKAAYGDIHIWVYNKDITAHYPQEVASEPKYITAIRDSGLDDALKAEVIGKLKRIAKNKEGSFGERNSADIDHRYRDLPYCTFFCSGTEEGMRYWYRICDKLQDNKSLASNPLSSVGAEKPLEPIKTGETKMYFKTVVVSQKTLAASGVQLSDNVIFETKKRIVTDSDLVAVFIAGVLAAQDTGNPLPTLEPSNMTVKIDSI